ncbi:MAG: hypothetical protein VW683_15705 [Betaproteobacteria bacterium]
MGDNVLGIDLCVSRSIVDASTAARVDQPECPAVTGKTLLDDLVPVMENASGLS